MGSITRPTYSTTGMASSGGAAIAAEPEASRQQPLLPQDPATALACAWVIDATSGRPVCFWSVETWRPHPSLYK
jgi:hypothetical protein